jgi:hypothetical protein
VQWFTTWLAHPDYLGQGIGAGLMQAALDLGQDYMIVGSAPARHICRKFGFHELPEYSYAVVDFGLAGRYNPASVRGGYWTKPLPSPSSVAGASAPGG